MKELKEGSHHQTIKITEKKMKGNSNNKRLKAAGSNIRIGHKILLMRNKEQSQYALQTNIIGSNYEMEIAAEKRIKTQEIEAEANRTSNQRPGKMRQWKVTSNHPRTKNKQKAAAQFDI